MTEGRGFREKYSYWLSVIGFRGWEHLNSENVIQVLKSDI